MINVIPVSTRTIVRDGEVINQIRLIECELKTKWYRPFRPDIQFIATAWVDDVPLKLTTFRKGDKVKSNSNSGFHKGAEGIVEFVEPSGRKVWVLRDNSKTPVYFSPNELELIWRPVSE